MADTKTSAESAASALAGAELIRGVQSGGNVKITATQIQTFANSVLAAIATSGSASDLSAGTLPAGRFPALTGDVTTAAGALATAIANNAVTTAKINNGAVTEAKQTLADNTTGNVSTSAHGYAPKAPNDATKYLDGTGAYSVPAGAIPRSYIAGLALSNDGITPNSVLDIAAGQAADGTNAALISSGAFTKSTAGAWASGSGSNGMGNGLTIANSTWYHVILANNGGTPDIYFDTSATGANRPAGISDSKVRRIGSFLTDGSAHILAFVQDGDTFYWSALPQDVSVTNLGTTATLYALSTPLGVKTRPLLRISAGTINSSLIISSPDEPDLQPPGGSSVTGAETSPGWDFCYNTNPAGNVVGLYTNTSSQIRARADAASRHLTIYTRGYVDDRGRYN